MAKTLIQEVWDITKKGIAIISIPLTISGCISSKKINKEPIEPENKKEFVNTPEGHILGVEYPILTQDKVPYTLEEQVLYGERYYLQKTEKTPTTLEMSVLPYNDVIRELDLDANKIELTAKREYIPRKVEIKDGKDTKDDYADEITLRTDGSYGLKAYMLSQSQLRDMANVSKDNYGYKVITTEDGASFAIKTVKILGEEYFFPYVADKKVKEEGKLPFYLIPVKGAKIKIDNKCGNLSIYNENEIYRPIDPTKFPDLFKETNPLPGKEQEIFLYEIPPR